MVGKTIVALFHALNYYNLKKKRGIIKIKNFIQR